MSSTNPSDRKIVRFDINTRNSLPKTSQAIQTERLSSTGYIAGSHSHNDPPQTTEREPERPGITRRVTWDDKTLEHNPTIVPEALKKAVCARSYQSEQRQSHASWFEGSPHNLDERRQLQMDDKKVMKDLRKWRAEHDRRSSLTEVATEGDPMPKMKRSQSWIDRQVGRAQSLWK